MRVLVVVAQHAEISPIKRLLASAGYNGASVYAIFDEAEDKPKMVELRKRKLAGFDEYVRAGEYDYIIAAGETAARLVLDTSTVNINKLRGRDFDYAYGVRDPKKNKKTGEAATTGG
jgi:hypothetical protein